jgi:hypothetical protein
MTSRTDRGRPLEEERTTSNTCTRLRTLRVRAMVNVAVAMGILSTGVGTGILSGPPAQAAGGASVIATVVGNGSGTGCSGDGGPATAAGINTPQAVAVAPNGNLFIADAGNNVIRMVPAGSGTFFGQSMIGGDIYTVVGHGSGPSSPCSPPGYGGDGGPASGAQLNEPAGLALGSDGSLFIVDLNNYRVRVVPAVSGTFYRQEMTAGHIYTIAGDGVEGDSGDGGPATAAHIGNSETLAVGSDGSLDIADFTCNCIRKVTPDGTIHTFVSGIATPLGVGFDTAGNLYVAAVDGQQIIRFTPSGSRSVYAGTGVAGYSGDGGQASAAQLHTPHGLAIGADGSVYFSDRTNSRVRVISRQAVISTYAGNGTAGFSGDGGAATAAEIDYVEAVAIGLHGDVYIADALNNRVREIVAPPPQVVITARPQTTTTATSAVLGYDESGGAPVNTTTCMLDSHPVACSDTAARLAGLSLGTHSFTVTATSASGKSATDGATWTVVGAPSVRITVPPGDVVDARTTTLIHYDESAGGPVSATTCMIDGSPLTCSATSASLSDLTVGFHKFTVTATGPDTTSASASTTLTAGLRPTVADESADVQNAHSVLVSGAGNPGGLLASYYFQYGLDTSYGHVTAPGDAGSGTRAVVLTASLENLSANTIYHVRLVVSNDLGSSEGPDFTFLSPPQPTAPLPGKPTVTIGIPVNGLTYIRSEVVLASYSCAAAAGASLVSCAGPVPNGRPIDTTSVGSHAFTVTASDNLGSSSSSTVMYTIAPNPLGALKLPALTRLRQSAVRWREPGGHPNSANTRLPVGTTFSFTLSVPARVRLNFSSTADGRRIGARCVAERHANRNRPRCVRTISDGTMTIAGKKGTNKIRFSGRLSRTKRLQPGVYTLSVVVITAGGQRSSVATLRFRIA